MRLCKVVLTLGIIALVSAPALAQGRRGGGVGQGGGGIGILVANKSVQEELKMDKDQVTKADDAMKKVREDLKDDYAKLGGRGGGNQATPEERTAARKKINEATEKALKDVLKDDQLKRIHQIAHQQQGLAIFTDEEAQKTLKLTDDQKSKIKTISDDLQKEVRDAFGGGGGKPNPEALTKVQTLRKEAMSNATKTLTDDQKKALKDLTGEPFEVKFEAGGRRGGNKPRTDF